MKSLEIISITEYRIAMAKSAFCDFYTKKDFPAIFMDLQARKLGKREGAVSYRFTGKTNNGSE
jgi:hypothetical protein